MSNQLGGNVTETHANHNENQHTHKKKRTFENSIFKVIFLPIITRLICELPWQQLRNTTLISYKVVVNALTLSSVHRPQFFTPRFRAVLFPKGHVVSIEDQGERSSSSEELGTRWVVTMCVNSITATSLWVIQQKIELAQVSLKERNRFDLTNKNHFASKSI